MKKYYSICILMFFLLSCSSSKQKLIAEEVKHFKWEGANLYFLLIDRFYNGNSANDQLIPRTQPTGMLRGFEGGDLRGVIKKLDEDYFTKLGINAIWLSPVVEQIHGSVDEGTGNTYGFHGYWTKDWTAIDPSYGTKNDLKELVDKAHKKGIKIVLDAVINHTGPVTNTDPVWPNSWVRTSPKCTYNSYDSFINCTLVENLPDIKTESDENVTLPQHLIEKWKKEGRYETEVAELDAFFKETGYPRAPRYYIMKWLADYVLDYGIDGYRADTVKHTNENVWVDFQTICQNALNNYHKKHKTSSTVPFFTVGEVYGYSINGKKLYDFGDKKVDYFANGFSSLINFDFRNEANLDYETLFSKYNSILLGDLKGFSVMNYISSHDDGYPFDKKREKAFDAANKLLLAPGISQIYYGDETSRVLEVKDAVGDANLRSNMNWNDLTTNNQTRTILDHYQKLGKFRSRHIAIGAGEHKLIQITPNYWFSRKYENDVVVVGLNLPIGEKEVSVSGIYPDDTYLKDTYSNQVVKVVQGKVKILSEFTTVLLENAKN
jgi:alpha-amylase